MFDDTLCNEFLSGLMGEAVTIGHLMSENFLTRSIIPDVKAEYAEVITVDFMTRQKVSSSKSRIAA